MNEMQIETYFISGVGVVNVEVPDEVYANHLTLVED